MLAVNFVRVYPRTGSIDGQQSRSYLGGALIGGCASFDAEKFRAEAASEIYLCQSAITHRVSGVSENRAARNIGQNLSVINLVV